MKLQGNEGAEVLGFGSERWLAVRVCHSQTHMSAHIHKVQSGSLGLDLLIFMSIAHMKPE